jgi:predicted nucleic acid-binding Zn ribbon protein
VMFRKDAKHVGGILDGLINKLEKGTVKKGNAIRIAWIAACGEETGKHARPVSLKNGVLMVIVDNSVWLYKLTLEKLDLKNKFNNVYTGRKKVDNIRFRVGSTDI